MNVFYWKKVGILTLSVFLISAVQAQAQNPIPIEDLAITCPSLPCTYKSYDGRDFLITGEIDQDQLMALGQTNVFIEGVPLGAVHMNVSILEIGEVLFYGEIKRFEGNSAGLEPLQVPFSFSIDVPDGGVIPGTIPYLDVHQAVIFSVTMLLREHMVGDINESSASGGSNDVPGGDQERIGPFDCSGPLLGVPGPLPIPLGGGTEEMQDCCIQHDICFMNGGANHGVEEECDKELKRCILAVVPWWSYPYSATALTFLDGPDANFTITEPTECRCTVDEGNLTREQLDAIKTLSNDNLTTTLGHERCQRSQACAGSCRMLLTGFLPDGRAGWASIEGSCQPARR